jgi:tetratricopeptide (TPR) repeat protein
MKSMTYRPFRFSAAAILPLVAAILTCQCVYFNLFYNAKLAFDTAYAAHTKLLEKYPDSLTVTLPPDIQANYDKAIEKASRIAEEYPKQKKWHDRAVFLIGRCYFYKADYDKAVRTFKQLQQEFPASKFVPESYVYIGKSYLFEGNLDKAEETFAFIIDKFPELNKNQEVALLTVDVSIRRGSRAMAIELLEKTAAGVKSKILKADLMIKTAHLAMDLQQFDKAIRIFTECPRNVKRPDQLYRIDVGLASCYEAKGAFPRALEMVGFMLDNKIYSSHLSDIYMIKASLLRKTGKTDDAIAVYRIVTARDSTSDAAALAWYALGTIYQTKKVDYVKAKECFAKASSMLKDTLMRAAAAQSVKSIDTLTFYRAMKDTIDTLKNSARRNRVDFKIGELFWLELDQPDSAFSHFKGLSCKNDSLKPKALYCAAYIARHALRDTASADSLYKVLLNAYPANEFTKKTQEDRGEKLTILTRADSAQQAFAAAETLFYDRNDSLAAVEAYKGVYEKYPDCEAGIKGLYAAAWVSDNVLSNHKTAFRLYRMLCDSFPKSDICLNDVQPKLKVVSDTLAARKAKHGGQAGAMSDASVKQKPPIASAAPAQQRALKADSTLTPRPGPDMYSRMRMGSGRQVIAAPKDSTAVRPMSTDTISLKK